MAETPERSGAGRGPGESCPPDHVHDIASAAIRARVSPDTVRGWIRDGMRAMPIGRVGKGGHAHYRIKDAWLMEFMDRRARDATQDRQAPAPTVEKPKARRPRAAMVPDYGVMDLKDPIGPIRRGGGT